MSWPKMSCHSCDCCNTLGIFRHNSSKYWAAKVWFFSNNLRMRIIQKFKNKLINTWKIKLVVYSVLTINYNKIIDTFFVS